MDYDYYKEMGKKFSKKKLQITSVVIFVLAFVFAAQKIYTDIIQLNEMGNYSGVYLKNLLFQVASFLACFIVIFLLTFVTAKIINRNLAGFYKANDIMPKKLPVVAIAAILALIGSFLSKEIFFMKILSTIYAQSFGAADPIFSKDVGYYVFTRPLFMAIYSFLITVWGMLCVFTLALYTFKVSLPEAGFSYLNLKDKKIIRHNVANVAIFFILKAVSYPMVKESILYSSVVNYTGAGFADVNIMLKYFEVIPFIIVLVTILAVFFVRRQKYKFAGISFAVFPAIWIITIAITSFTQFFIVDPNEYDYEKQFISYNIEKTREAYGLNKIKTHDFPEMQELTPDMVLRNKETIDNIRVIDIPSTLVSNVQMQSNTAFYTFNNGDIINYTVNGRNIPVFITAREIDKNKLPDKTYLNATYRYTHGYGVVMNPINKFGQQGQVDFILSGLVHKSLDPEIKIERPEIYYGELTKDHVIVNAKGLQEIDYDGSRITTYSGQGGIKLTLLNKILFAIKYADFKMLISGYTNDATLLLNREIIARAQKAVPFLSIDQDPYIVLTAAGRLVWVLDAYTTTDKYPYSESYNGINYVKNSVKILIDAYDGKVECYIIDQEDPIIKTYDKMYPGVFKREALPLDISAHMKYPELLFIIQTDMLKRYHIKEDDVATFYTQQDLWAIARYPTTKESGTLTEIEPYYNMIELPEGFSEKEELIMMRPFTPSGELKHNMVSWLAVRNSIENYGEMILFNFPKNTNIFGPNQIEVKINQIDEVSSDMSLWGQSGSRVYKGNLLVIPVENTVLYVEPIYIQSAGTSSIPEVRKVVVGYQQGEEFKYGLGIDLKSALDDLFGVQNAGSAIQIPGSEQGDTDGSNIGGVPVLSEEDISAINSKIEELRKQLEDLKSLINGLAQ